MFGVVGGLLCGIMALIGNLIRLNLTAKLVPIGAFEKSEYFYRVGLSTDNIFEFTGALNFVSAESLSLPEEQIRTNSKNDEVNEQSKDLVDKVLIISLARVTSVDIVGANALIAFAKSKSSCFRTVAERPLTINQGWVVNFDNVFQNIRFILSMHHPK